MADSRTKIWVVVFTGMVVIGFLGWFLFDMDSFLALMLLPIVWGWLHQAYDVLTDNDVTSELNTIEQRLDELEQ